MINSFMHTYKIETDQGEALLNLTQAQACMLESIPLVKDQLCQSWAKGLITSQELIDLIDAFFNEFVVEVTDHDFIH